LRGVHLTIEMKSVSADDDSAEARVLGSQNFVRKIHRLGTANFRLREFQPIYIKEVGW
jgi:hypothetical protein